LNEESEDPIEKLYKYDSRTLHKTGRNMQHAILIYPEMGDNPSSPQMQK